MSTSPNVVEVSVALVACAILAGCAPGADYRPSAPDSGVKDYSVGVGPLVREFRLEDGTRCVAQSKAISCDWKGPKQ